MVRHTVQEHGINDETGVAKFNRNLPGVDDIKQFVLKRVGIVDPVEASEVEADIERAWQEWESFAAGFAGTETEPVYSNFRMGRSKTLLATSTRDKRPLGWVAPNSMRNVDAECNINTRDE